MIIDDSELDEMLPEIKICPICGEHVIAAYLERHIEKEHG